MRALRWIGIGVLALLLLVGAAAVGIDTPAGHRLIAARVNDLKPPTGLRIHIGRIEGSIWARATLRDLRLADPDGRFFAAPVVTLAWHPLAWVDNRLDIDRLAAPSARLDRLPRLKQQGGSTLPGFAIHLGALQVGTLRLGASIAGRPEAAMIAARADIRHGEAVVGLRLATAGGDRVVLDLDARPGADRFRLAGQVNGPAGGAIGGLLGTPSALALKVGGAGDWHAWHGRAEGALGGRPIVALALAAQEGRYRLSGTLAPSALLQGKLQRLTEPSVHVAGEGTLAARQLVGRVAFASPALQLVTQGRVDLAASAFVGLRIDAHLLRPAALFPNMTGQDVRLRLDLDGPFRRAAFRYALASPHVAFDTTGFDGVRASGAGRFGAVPVAVPIRLHAARVTGIGDVAGGILADLSVAGVLHVDSRLLVGTGFALASDKLKGSLGLRLDLVSGRFDVGVTGGLARYLIPGLGIVDVTTKASVEPGPNGLGTIVTGRGQAVVQRFDNGFLRSLAGGNPRVNTGLVRDPDGVLHFVGLVLTGPAIRITGSGLRRRDGTFQFSGTGRQAVYGAFRIELDGMIDHPRVRLVLDRPLDALGLAQVALDLDPVAEGFRFAAGGGSTLGRFTANGLIRSGAAQPTVIDVADLAVSGTQARGSVRADPQGFTGRLDLAGPIAGTMAFAPVGGIQRIEPHLVFRAATLAVDTPVTVRAGRLDGGILLDPAGMALDGSLTGTGIGRGGLTLSRASASAHLRGGRGTVQLAAAGDRGRTFDLSGGLDLAAGRIVANGRGTIAGRPIQLVGPAVLTPAGDGWSLASTRINYAGGSLSLGGTLGGAVTDLQMGVERLPLTLLDVASPGLDLGGYASGTLAFRTGPGAAPTGRLDLALRNLTRAGLVASSAPADVALAAVLTPNGAAARAVVASGGRTIGRAQAKIGPLAPGADLLDRLSRAPLFGQIRYAGPAETLWRLSGVETIDLSGPLALSADVGGTAAQPLIRGTLTSSNGRLESSVSGTVISALQASGRFDGSRLTLDRLSGKAGPGSVTGRGSVDLGHLATGVGLDLALQAENAALLARDDIAATVTGPLTLRSSGAGGVIGGEVTIDRGRFRLGSAAVAQVPHLAVTEVNRPESEIAVAAPPAPWILALKANARSQLFVTGLGIDSEWRAALDIKGAVDNPAIAGRVDLVRGGYQFAGRRFELDRGLIRFGGQAPADPTLDITALADVSGFNATIHVTGTGLHPEIRFQSVPALPEDELLARLLFGTSITNLSAPEALQLASAVASLRSGGGGGYNLDPINAVRKMVRLDRLRILPADPTTGQKTAVAAGKYLGRRTYVELITDGQGYSATSIEFRITRWLSLLSTVSTVGRQSANVKVSKDY